MSRQRGPGDDSPDVSHPVSPAPVMMRAGSSCAADSSPTQDGTGNDQIVVACDKP